MREMMKTAVMTDLMNVEIQERKIPVPQYLSNGNRSGGIRQDCY